MGLSHDAWRGFTRPFTLVWALRERPDDWRRFLVTTTAQVLLTLTLALLVFGVVDDGFTPLKNERVLARLAVLYSALLTAQWVMLALGREFHRPLGRALSALAHVEPEDPDVPPRVRVEWRWLKKKLKQRVYGLLVLLPGFAAFVPIFLLTKALGLDDYVMPPLMAGWSFYWFCCFTAGRSDLAWKDAATALPFPWRWWQARTERTPGFRWFLPRWVLRFAAAATRENAPAALAFERAPVTFVGLGLSRLLLSVPLVRLYFRAAVDVAAAEALAHAPAVTRA